MYRKFFLLLLLSLPLWVHADEDQNPNVLTVERVAGTVVKAVGKYKFVFSITKDWKTLHMTVTDLKDQPVLLDLAQIEITVRPNTKKAPFNVVMKNRSEAQDGQKVTTHYEAALDFIEEFNSFNVNLVITLEDEQFVSEYSFKR